MDNELQLLREEQGLSRLFLGLVICFSIRLTGTWVL
jgi:hypothetical protein